MTKRLDDHGNPTGEMDWHHGRYDRRETEQIGFVDRQKLEATGGGRSCRYFYTSFEAYAAKWGRHDIDDMTKPDLSKLRAAMAAAHPDRSRWQQRGFHRGAQGLR
jgi:hypothetical protein